MKKLFLVMAANILVLLGTMAQTVISGKVLEAGSNKPIAAATVFISNSSAGVSTTDNGAFSLQKLPGNKFTLVVSCVGYETFVKDFRGPGSQEIMIVLQQKATALDEVVITPAEKNGWINWGDLFIEHLIGKSAYGKACRIKNPKVLKFRKNEKENFLTVAADEPVIIENKLLGYVIRYSLKEFKYYFSSNTVYYSGYALFDEASPGDEKAMARYMEARTKVYNISLLHFIRSLYNENQESEGFKIIRKTANGAVEVKKGSLAAIPEYNGIEQYDTVYEISNTSTQIKILPVANAAANRPLYTSSDKASVASIVTHDNGNVLFNFPDTLQVVYNRASIPPEYSQYAIDSRTGTTIVSELSLVRPGAITITANGSYEPTNLLMNGFWGWWEKLSIMLPYDFQPSMVLQPATKQ